MAFIYPCMFTDKERRCRWDDGEEVGRRRPGRPSEMRESCVLGSRPMHCGLQVQKHLSVWLHTFKFFTFVPGGSRLDRDGNGGDGDAPTGRPLSHSQVNAAAAAALVFVGG